MAADYEFDHHARLGRRAGVTDEDLDAVRRDPQTLPERDALLLAAADELVEHRDLTDETWTRLRAVLSERETIELLLLVGHYDMLATTLMTLRVQPDRRR